MTQKQVQWRWLSGQETVTQTELSDCCGISEAELNELIDYCALEPIAPTAPQNIGQAERNFSTQWVIPLRHAAKLRLDFDLDIFTVAVLLGSFNRIEVLERQVQALQALLPPGTHCDSESLAPGAFAPLRAAAHRPYDA